MMESFLILFREGVEVALVIGILIVYLRKLQKPDLIPAVYIGLALAVFASVIGALLFRKFGVDNESIEGYLLFLAAIFVTSMIIWMWITARGIRQEIERKIDTIVARSSSWKITLGIMIFSFLMVFREGIETAVFLGAVSFSQGMFESFLGGLFGVAAAVAFGVLFVKGSLRIDIARFLKVTALVLLIFVAQLLVNAIHEFFEQGVLPPRPEIMGIVGPLVRNNLLFILAIISIPAFMLIIPSSNKERARDITRSTNRRWQLTAGVLTLSVVFFLGFNDVLSSRNGPDISPAKPVVLNDNYIHLPLNEVDDGHLHRYTLKQDTIEIRFFVVRTGLNSYATAFDACRPCYNYGKYYISGSDVICSQCEAAYPLSRLHRQAETALDEVNATFTEYEDSGCFPMFLRSKIRGAEVLIAGEDLLEKRQYFELKKEEL